MKRSIIITLISLISFFYLLNLNSSHSQKFDTDWLFYDEPDGPMKRRE